MTPSSRKAASRAADIPPDVLERLSLGEISGLTLTECLAVDQARLLRRVFPELPAGTLALADAACRQGILKRMATIGQLLWNACGPAGLARCRDHAADTVRGWACFMIGAAPDLSLQARLHAIAPLADDEHFGVREWAWMALRPALAGQLDEAIAQLAPWTASPSERQRRFACEALRPRGVWCAHLAALKRDPALALPILQALRADPAVYVQDSVANWLNDAGKDQGDWVRALCARWQQQAPGNEATRRICQRALRNLA